MLGAQKLPKLYMCPGTCAMVLTSWFLHRLSIKLAMTSHLMASTVSFNTYS